VATSLVLGNFLKINLDSSHIPEVRHTSISHSRTNTEKRHASVAAMGGRAAARRRQTGNSTRDT